MDLQLRQIEQEMRNDNKTVASRPLEGSVSPDIFRQEIDDLAKSCYALGAALGVHSFVSYHMGYTRFDGPVVLRCLTNVQRKLLKLYHLTGMARYAAPALTLAHEDPNSSAQNVILKNPPVNPFEGQTEFQFETPLEARRDIEATD